MFFFFYIVCLTYTTDCDVLEWLVKLKVLHRLKYQTETLVHWSTFWNQHDQVCLWQLCWKSSTFKLTFVSHNPFRVKTEKLMVTQSWNDHHSDIQCFTDHLEIGYISVMEYKQFNLSTKSLKSPPQKK